MVSPSAILSAGLCEKRGNKHQLDTNSANVESGFFFAVEIGARGNLWVQSYKKVSEVQTEERKKNLCFCSVILIHSDSITFACWESMLNILKNHSEEICSQAFTGAAHSLTLTHTVFLLRWVRHKLRGRKRSDSKTGWWPLNSEKKDKIPSRHEWTHQLFFLAQRV